MPQTNRSPLFIQSLEKALFVLESFGEAEQLLSLTEISKISGLDKPAAQRCVHTLVQTGYLEKDQQSGRFSLGKKVLDLSFHFLRAHPLVIAATPLSLDVKPGERMALLGPSGCGKTTTLRIVAGFSKPDTGSLHIGDRDVTELPPHKPGLGMVFQNYSLDLAR